MIETDLTKLKTVEIEPLLFISKTGLILEEMNKANKIIETIINELNNNNLLYLSAPEIGINKRIICLKFDNQIKSFINPVITAKRNYTLGAETFNSLPNKEILVSRPEEITLVYYNQDFKYEENKFVGTAAKILDQELQLFENILPNDIGLISDIETDGKLADLSEEDFKEVVEIYKQFIETKIKNLTTDLSEEEQREYRQIKFTENVINGQTVVADDGTLQKAFVDKQNKKFKKTAAQEEFKNFIKHKGRK
jgi:peptide deformylase